MSKHVDSMLGNLITSMPFYVCAFWSVVLMMDVARTRQIAKLRLLVYMLAATVLYLGHYVFFNGLREIQPLTDTLYCLTNLLVFPLYYLYLRELTVPDNTEYREWPLYVPAVTMSVAYGVLYALVSPYELNRFFTFYLYNNSRFDLLSGLAWWLAVAHHLAKTLFALQIPPILWYGYRHISQYNQRVDAFYADTDDKSLRQMKSVLVVFVVVAIISFVANALGRHLFTNSLWLLAVPSAAFSALQFLLGYLGHRQNFSVADLMADEAKGGPAVPVDEVASEDEYSPTLAALRDRFFSMVSTERLYLQPNLKVTDLADRLQTNRTYLQHIIRKELGCTFTEYINRQRIDYACTLMDRQPDRPISEVCAESGFTSLPSFYRNFKLYRHCSPADYSITAK